jgi:hypothetical protein
MKSASLVDPCPHCGEMVRTGLVRCWSCNGFMREDIAARYRDMTTNPQPIIYSTVPKEQRTDFLPPRGDNSRGPAGKVYDAEDFLLSDDSADKETVSTSSGFELNATPETKPEAAVDGPDKPQNKTPGGKNASEAGKEIIPEKAETPADPGEETPVGSEDLLSIAMQEEREVKRRRSGKIAERQRKQMLVPCSCGAWIRVHEDKAGKVVRCRQCKQPISVPTIRRKVEKKENAIAESKIDVTWIEGVRFFRVAPTSIVLKPGSVADKFIEADIAVTDSQLVVVAFTGGATKKRGFMSKAPKIDLVEQRKQIRETVAAVGDFSTLVDVEVHPLLAEQISEIRLVQPILKAHESMFAGVPVFGEGRIALFLPIASGDGQQAYCSQSLTSFRMLEELLKKNFALELPAAENGVPESDKTDNLICFINQSRVESIRGLNYYQQDPVFELELSGYRCTSCSAVVSEDGRKKAKLGGANGKGIAKAKCPKCSGKMGEEPLYSIKKAPEAETSSDTADE